MQDCCELLLDCIFEIETTTPEPVDPNEIPL